jgi:VWFA-related protein
MPSFRVLLRTGLLLIILPVRSLIAQGQQSPSGAPTIRVTSSLVFLDVTVLDKKGRPVVKGLTQNDFTITEGKKPQRIISFEVPEAHVMGAGAGNDNPEGKVPVAIFVLDLLNSSFADFAYIRYEVRQYLVALPPHLDFPAELMVLGNRRLEMQQGYTRNRDDLLYALDHLEPWEPYKLQNGGLVLYFINKLTYIEA